VDGQVAPLEGNANETLMAARSTLGQANKPLGKLTEFVTAPSVVGVLYHWPCFVLGGQASSRLLEQMERLRSRKLLYQAWFCDILDWTKIYKTDIQIKV
jgi:hypothetical protein